MRMAGSAKQMGALIQSLLDYSRPTTRLGPPEKVDLSSVVQDIVGEVKPVIESIDGRIEVGPLPVIEADGAQMRHLFRNLIGNSIEFSKSNETLRIRVHGQSIKDHVQISAEDNGIGFDEGCIDRIFRPFQQLHARRGQYDGTGMGLAICRKIVELHAGAITAKSTSGAESIFTVSLPIISSREGLLPWKATTAA
jgi:signal transduction histidine kinase